MGIKLPVPLAPFQELDVQGESITIDVNAKQIVIPTDNQYVLPSFNQWTLNPNRCNLEETPCGGLKNSIVQDSFPGSLSIEGDGCYLQNLAGTYTGKSIGAGKLAETSNILNTGSVGTALKTTDGIKVAMKNGDLILLSPPSAIVEQFKIINTSTDPQTYSIKIQCPNLIQSIGLSSLLTGSHKTLTLTKISSNMYQFSGSISYNSYDSLQLTIIYNSLKYTQSFINDGNTTTGLQNMSKSWIALLPKNGHVIDFFHLTERPEKLEYKQDVDGTISQITLYPGNGSIYYGQITHADHLRVSGTGYIPDCLNKNITGSITKFLQAHGMKPNFLSDTTLTTWVVPAISDDKILPYSAISDSLLGNTIELRMSPGEYGCASFVINSDKNIKLSFECSDFASSTDTIPGENIQVKYVKCWIQSGIGSFSYSNIGKYLTPELLLNDDSLISVEMDQWEGIANFNTYGKNYAKLIDGTYTDISTNTEGANPNINDSEKILPINLSKNYTKQMWLTLHVPSSAHIGNYNGCIYIKSNGLVLKTIDIDLTVLPIILLDSPIEYSIYYTPLLTTQSTITERYKTVEQYTADLQNMLDHGVTNPDINTALSDVSTVLSIRQQLGFNNSHVYAHSKTIITPITDVQSYMTIASSHGIPTVYFYGIDENDLTNTAKVINGTSYNLPALIDGIHNVGGKVYCSQNYAQAQAAADFLDVAIVSLAPDSSLAALYHDPTGKYDSKPHKIFSYADPQTIPEYPRTFRLNYGFLLWQNDYDGAMDFAYQFEPSTGSGNIWNDFDQLYWRDHCFAYPTLDSYVNTVQFEGYREASNDMRYLATLQAAITEAKTRGIYTTDIESWLATLKTTDLSTTNLDVIRSQIIDYILYLQNTKRYQAVLMANNSPIVFKEHTQLFLEV